MSIVDLTHVRMNALALIDQKARAEKDLIDARFALIIDESRDGNELCKKLEWDCDPTWLKTFVVIGRLERLNTLSSRVRLIENELKKALNTIVNFNNAQ
jgi:hypothetical protein